MSQTPEHLYQQAYAKAYDEQWAEISGGEMTDTLLALVNEAGVTGGRWLDLCCGSGRLLVEAREAGYQVAGLDLSADLLEIARQLNPGAELVQACLPDCPIQGPFEVISCLGSSLSCLHSEDDLKATLQKVYELLGREGVFIADASTPYSMQCNDGERVAFQGEQGDFIVALSFDEAAQVLDWQVTGYYPQGSGHYHQYRELHQLKAWDLDLVKEMMESLGMEVTLLDRDSLLPLDDESWHALLMGKVKQ